MKNLCCCCCSVTKSFHLHGPQHTRLPCPSSSPRICSNSCPSHSLLPASPPDFHLPQHQGLFQWVGSSHQVDKVLELKLQHKSFQCIFSISLRVDLFYPLAVEGTLKNLLQHYSLRSILLCSAFLMVQPSYPYMAIRKNTALMTQTIVSKVMSQLFKMLSSFVIAFLPRSKCLLILRLKSPSALILETKENLPLFPHLFAMKW